MNNGTRAERRDLLTVLQAAPLASRNSDSGDFVGLEYLDCSSERDILTETIKDAVGDRIDIHFDIATTDRLDNFLSKAQGRILHFSCHGTKEYIALENGWARMQSLFYDQLKKWIELGGKRLEFVFLAACESEEAGEALIAAGIPHVVCCRTVVLNVALVEFEKVFYRHLASGKTLEESFNLARHGLLHSPLLPDNRREEQVAKFVLLPENGNHNVPIFFTEPYARSSNTTSQKPPLVVSIPPPLAVFVGREMAMYDLMTPLQSSQLLRVSGGRGIGKNALVRACCHYMSYESRARIMKFQEFLWLPLAHGEPQDNKLYDSLSRLWRYFQNAHAQEPPINDIIHHFRDKTALLVCDTAKHDFSTGGLQKLSNFLATFLPMAPNTKVIVIHHEDHVLPTQGIEVAKADYQVPALDFYSTVKLFAQKCPHVSAHTYPQIRYHTDFEGHIFRALDDERLVKGLFKRLGEGVPKKICDIAMHITAPQYRDIVLMSGATVGSRVELEMAVTNLSEQSERAKKEKDFDVYCTLQEKLRVFDLLRQEYPSEEQLEEISNDFQRKLMAAADVGDRSKLDELRRELDSVQSLLEKEKEARVSLGLQPPDPNAPPIQYSPMKQAEFQAHMKEIKGCTEVQDFIAMYDCDGLVRACLDRLRLAQGEEDPSTWAKEWAINRNKGDPTAIALDGDRKLCMELLYTLLNRWKGEDGPKTLSTNDVVKRFKTKRIMGILGPCLYMDRANCLYNMTYAGIRKPGMHWVSKVHMQRNPKWMERVKACGGRATMNKRLMWLVEDEDLQGLELHDNGFLLELTTPVLAPWSVLLE